MSSVPQHHRFAPPRTPVDDLQMESAPLASRGARLGAAMIDALVMLVVFSGLSALTPFDPWTPPEHGVAVALLINAVLGLATFTLFNGYLLAMRGQTVGKALVGLRIVRGNGEAASFGRLIGLRYGVGWMLGVLPFIGGIYALLDLLLIFRVSRQCLHDAIADTIVIVR